MSDKNPDNIKSNQQQKCSPCVINFEEIDKREEKPKTLEDENQVCEDCQCTEQKSTTKPLRKSKIMPPKLDGPVCCKKPTHKKPHDVIQRIDVKNCAKVDPPHPCDPPPHCDPFAKPLMECQPPYICWERIKNPALPTEITKCQPGAFMNAKRCAKVDPPHPCDPLPPCGPNMPRRQCDRPTLCQQRIKNWVPPDGMQIKDPCVPPEDAHKMPVYPENIPMT